MKTRKQMKINLKRKHLKTSNLPNKIICRPPQSRETIPLSARQFELNYYAVFCIFLRKRKSLNQHSCCVQKQDTAFYMYSLLMSTKKNKGSNLYLKN